MQRWHALAEMAKAAAVPAPAPVRAEPSAGRELRRLLWWTLGGLAGAIACFEAARFMFTDAPSARQLTAAAQEGARLVLAQQRSPATPWRLDSARAAASNGTESYRQLQRSLADARVAARQHGLDVSVPALQEVPELPELLDVTAKEGDKLVVRVPFTARRGLWRWQTGAPELIHARANRRLEGQSLTAWGKVPYLRFDTAAERANMRQQMQRARDFVLTTNRELLARGLPPANRPATETGP